MHARSSSIVCLAVGASVRSLPHPPSPAMTQYEPTATDMAWQRGLLNTLKDGGTWGWPNAELCYRIDKTNKVATMTLGDPESEEAGIAEAVWNAIGWQVNTAVDRNVDLAVLAHCS